MTDDDPLTLDEAFRLVLRDRRSGPLADVIRSYDDLHLKAVDNEEPFRCEDVTIGLTVGRSYLFPFRDEDERADATAAADLIEDAIGDFRLPMRGRRGRKGRFESAGREDQRFGRPRIFESELWFYKPGSREVDEDISWYECTVRRGDVLKLIAPPAHETPGAETNPEESPPKPRAPARQVPKAAVDAAITGQRNWILEQRPKEREIKRRVEEIAGGRVSRTRLRAALRALVSERRRGRPGAK